MSISIRKKILFLDAYFNPEKTAYTHLENDLIESLVDNGFEVTVICPQPTRGVSEEERRGFLRREKGYKGFVFIKRFKCMKERKSILSRFFRYVYASIKTYKNAKKEKNVEVIFCNSTPPIQGLIALKVQKYFSRKFKRHIPFIYNLQDLFPDSMVSAGIVKRKSLFYNIGSKISKRIYEKSDQIITISNTFRNKLVEEKVDRSKISVVYNWIDINKIKPVSRSDNFLFEKCCIDRTDKIVCYAGNFGYAQDLAAIVKLTSFFENENVKFVFFGGGPLFDEYSIKLKRLKNAYVFPLMPQEYISEVYSLGDLYLLSCKKGLGNTSFPSKIWSILACNKYIIGLYDKDSEVNEFISNNLCGEIVNQESLEEQVLAIKHGLLINGKFRDVAIKFGNKENATLAYLAIINKSFINEDRNEKCSNN